MASCISPSTADGCLGDTANPQTNPDLSTLRMISSTNLNAMKSMLEAYNICTESKLIATLIERSFLVGRPSLFRQETANAKRYQYLEFLISDWTQWLSITLQEEVGPESSILAEIPRLALLSSSLTPCISDTIFRFRLFSSQHTFLSSFFRPRTLFRRPQSVRTPRLYCMFLPYLLHQGLRIQC